MAIPIWHFVFDRNPDVGAKVLFQPLPTSRAWRFEGVWQRRSWVANYIHFWKPNFSKHARQRFRVWCKKIRRVAIKQLQKAA
jgi:hypothetical protein